MGHCAWFSLLIWKHCKEDAIEFMRPFVGSPRGRFSVRGLFAWFWYFFIAVIMIHSGDVSQNVWSFPKALEYVYCDLLLPCFQSSLHICLFYLHCIKLWVSTCTLYHSLLFPLFPYWFTLFCPAILSSFSFYRFLYSLMPFLFHYTVFLFSNLYRFLISSLKETPI